MFKIKFKEITLNYSKIKLDNINQIFLLLIVFNLMPAAFRESSVFLKVWITAKCHFSSWNLCFVCIAFYCDVNISGR